MTDFVGAKAALICGDAVLTYLRDNHEGLPWPAHWDLPGGGREGTESAEQCLFREVMEEFALPLTPAHLTWRGTFPALHSPGGHAVFFAGQITAAEVSAIRFGSEGQTWQMMPLAQWLTHPRAVPDLPRRTEIALRELARQARNSSRR